MRRRHANASLVRESILSREYFKDAAEALGISYSTLYQMMNQGDIEYVLVGSRKYIAREKLLEFIERTHKGYYVAR